MAKDFDILDSVVAFASTSKITYAGSGIGFLALSPSNLDLFLKHYLALVIGPDKVNQAKHVKFFQKNGGVVSHMQKNNLVVFLIAIILTICFAIIKYEFCFVGISF